MPSKCHMEHSPPKVPDRILFRKMTAKKKQFEEEQQPKYLLGKVNLA